MKNKRISNSAVKRGLSLALVCVLLLSAAGCSVRKKRITQEKVLVSEGQDETVFVDEGSTSSAYSQNREEVTDRETSSVSSEASSAEETEQEEKDLVVTYNQPAWENESGFHLKTSDYIRNISLQRPKYAFGNSFKIDSGENTMWGCGPLDRKTVLKTIRYYDLGSSEVKIFQDCREWGYNFFMDANATSGNGQRKGGGGFDLVPTSRKLAYQMLKKGVLELYSVDITKKWESCPGHYLWQHYSCEWGADIIGAEIGEQISSIQTHLAFNRGAAVQYQVPWMSQFSFWGVGGYINDYTGTKVWGNDSAADGGHSPSLYRRALIASYMAGASHFYPEAGLTINYTNKIDGRGLYELSPVGKMTDQLVDFTHRNPNVGINYNPFGIVLDFYHGMFPGDYTTGEKRVFNTFKYNAGDEMSFQLLDLFFPDSWIVKRGGRCEENYMVNSPYGDTCDVLLQNASEEILNSYPCLILSGDISFSAEEIKRYQKYVKNGGTLVLNSAYLDDFPVYQKKYNGEERIGFTDGKGTVIVYGGDYDVSALDGILKDLLKRFIPFEISDTVEYMVNVKNGSLILTLINNAGYQYAHAIGGEKIDTAKTKEFTVRYTGGLKVKGLKELWSGQSLNAAESVDVTLTPGDVKIYEFRFD